MPGPISILATFIGYQVAGFLGAVAATVGVLIAPWLIIILTSFQIKKMQKNKWLKKFMNGAKLAIVCLLVVTLFSIGKEAFLNYWYILLGLIAMILSFKTKINPAFILLGCALGGLCIGLLTH